MVDKSPAWCARCRRAHTTVCPKRPVWEKKAHVKSGRGGRAWRRRREQIFKRDNFLCQIHLRKDELVAVTLHGTDAGVCDHVIPLSEGGTDDDSNLQTICQACDKEKTSLEAQRGRGVSKVLGS